MQKAKLILSLIAIMTVALAASAQEITVAHYLTFDDATPAILAQGDLYSPSATPERVWSVERIVSFANDTNDGPEIAASPLANPLQGGQVLICDPLSPHDEGLWVEMTRGFPIGDITVEAMFYLDEVFPARPPHALGLQYIVSCEIPFGELFQGQLRMVQGKLQWNAGSPLGEVRVETPADLLPDTWYHAAGVLRYNTSDPANSELELFLAAGAVINPATDSVGTAIINLDDPGVTVGFAPTSDPQVGPDAILGDPDNDTSDDKFRYQIGCSWSNAIAGTDMRGLGGAVDAVCVTAQAGTIYLPDAPPTPAVTAIGEFELYR